jgi:hypothetical protein
MNRQPWENTNEPAAAEYWKARCAIAEAALAKARAGLPMTALRRRILTALADLRQGEWMDARAANEVLAGGVEHARSILNALDRIGLVERDPERPGTRGLPARWRLAHLVQVPE